MIESCRINIMLEWLRDFPWLVYLKQEQQQRTESGPLVHQQLS